MCFPRVALTLRLTWIRDKISSDGEAPILDLWGMCCIPPLLTGARWLGVVVPVRALFIRQIEQFDHLTVCKQMTYLSELCYIAILRTI